MGEPNDDVLLGRLVRAFGGVPGIRAIALGGSRARGEATAQSDYDVGLYYEADHPIDVGRLAKAAMLLPGSINDQSWNAQGYQGVERLKAMGWEVAYSENVQAADMVEGEHV